MKTYKIEIVIKEGSDEFWEEITEDGKTGVDEVIHQLKSDLYAWTGVEIKLVSFTDK
jgi:hypothetical protein